jgi:PAS domain S-box-containing protein
MSHEASIEAEKIMSDTKESNRQKNGVLSETEALREEITRLKAMVDSSLVALTETDLQGNIIACNRAAVELTGHSSNEELIGESAFAMIAPEDRQRAQENLEITLREGYIENKEYTLHKKDGSEMIVELSARLVRDGKGRPFSFIGVINDVTSKKEMEAALARSARLNEKLRILMARLSTCSTIDEMLSPILDMTLEVTGTDGGGIYLVSDDQAVLRHFRNLPDDFVREVRCMALSTPQLQKVMHSDTPVDVTELSRDFSKLLQKHGLGHCYSVPLRDGKEVIGFLNVASTQSDPLLPEAIESLKIVVLEGESFFKRLRAEHALKRSEEMFRSVVESSPMGMHLYQLHEDGRLVFVGANPAADRLLGIDNSRIIGQTIEEAFPPLRDTEVPSRYRNAAAEGESWHTEQIDYEDDRIRGAFEVHAFQTTPGNVAAMFLEITSRKQAEENLKESEEKYRQLVENINDVIFMADIHGVLTYVSPAVALVTGYQASEMIGRSIFDFIHLEDMARIKETLARRLAGDDEPVEYRLRTRSGEIKWVRSSSRPLTKGDRVLGIQGILSDITASTKAETEKKHLETQLRQAQKMEAVGQLAGGVAHDFNNLLSPILGYSELLLMDLHPDDPRYGIVAEIRKAGSRAKDLTRQLLAFGRKQLIEAQSLDLSEVTRSFEKMLRRTIRENITIELKLAPSLGSVEADRSQIEQILMNLAVNAQDAMPDGGVMTIETGEITVSADYVRENPDIEEGIYVSLEIRDTGMGVDKASLPHIFEPFFTTKEKGKGTGLGLATVYGIVMQHGGNIDVESEPGSGSVFRILLPRSSDHAESPVMTPLVLTRSHGSETIAVVEDDEMVCHLACAILRDHGYNVISAGSADECLKLLEGETNIDMLLTDIVMPGMNGTQLYQTLSETRPDLKVLFMSGYMDATVESNGLMDSGHHFLQKPFSVLSLARKIREVLDS